MTSQTVAAPLPPAPVPAPDAWPGASKDKIFRKILAINTWRTEVASHEDGITCACSNGFSPVDGAAAATEGSDHARSRPQSCEVCQRPSSSAADDSSNTNGNRNSKSRGSSSRAGSGGLGSVRRVLRRLGTGHRSKTNTPPTTIESQMSTAGTRMYATQQEIANTAGEDSDDEGSSEEGGLKSKEARLRRAQKLLAKHSHRHRGPSDGARGGVDYQQGQEPVR